ncbi:MAG: orotidine-5'-phosphate decarboxylase [Acidobacteria bacterium]|nr:orotidine-5'-phosphate decarboxylase [Acidobacteriota bacterium]
MKEKLIVAVDLAERDAILALCDQLAAEVGLIKVGLQAFVANGPELVTEIRSRGIEVFLDLKLHDIPTTVEKATRAARELDVRMLTIHSSGGRAMLEAARRSAGESTLLLGVTVLTSLDDAELERIGFRHDPGDAVIRLAGLCFETGVDGVVASPHEIEPIRARYGGLTIVTPGIRMSSDAPDDQKRTMTPEEAIARGADYIVVGRPITRSDDPVAAARRVIDSMERGA